MLRPPVTRHSRHQHLSSGASAAGLADELTAMIALSRRGCGLTEFLSLASLTGQVRFVEASHMQRMLEMKVLASPWEKHNS